MSEQNCLSQNNQKTIANVWLLHRCLWNNNRIW